jgi:hypothetical protein
LQKSGDTVFLPLWCEIATIFLEPLWVRCARAIGDDELRSVKLRTQPCDGGTTHSVRKVREWVGYPTFSLSFNFPMKKGGLLMLRIVGLCIAVVVGLIMTINATIMLVSPRSWFRLPNWLKAQGSLIEDKYVTSGAAIQVRLTGAFILAAIAWVLCDMLLMRG